MKITPRLAMLSPHPPRVPHLQLDDGRELASRRVPDHHQHASMTIGLSAGAAKAGSLALDFMRNKHMLTKC
jgi:hypothetical protein